MGLKAHLHKGLKAHLHTAWRRPMFINVTDDVVRHRTTSCNQPYANDMQIRWQRWRQMMCGRRCSVLGGNVKSVGELSKE